MTSELQNFSTEWERETEGTLALMRALPAMAVADRWASWHGTSQKSTRTSRWGSNAASSGSM
jgi:hypothetical protein